ARDGPGRVARPFHPGLHLFPVQRRLRRRHPRGSAARPPRKIRAKRPQIKGAGQETETRRLVSLVEKWRKGVSPGYCRIDHHFFKEFATVCRQPIRNRCAIQSIVITLSALNRAAIFTLTASVFRRPSKSSSVQPRFFNSPATKRSAFCSSVSCFSTPP